MGHFEHFKLLRGCSAPKCHLCSLLLNFLSMVPGHFAIPKTWALSGVTFWCMRPVGGMHVAMQTVWRTRGNDEMAMPRNSICFVICICAIRMNTFLMEIGVKRGTIGSKTQNQNRQLKRNEAAEWLMEASFQCKVMMKAEMDSNSLRPTHKASQSRMFVIGKHEGTFLSAKLRGRVLCANSVCRFMCN